MIVEQKNGITVLNIDGRRTLLPTKIYEGRKAEDEVGQILAEHFGKEFIYMQFKIRPHSYSTCDFYVATPDGDFIVDVTSVGTNESLGTRSSVKRRQYKDWDDSPLLIVIQSDHRETFEPRKFSETVTAIHLNDLREHIKPYSRWYKTSNKEYAE